MGDHSSWFHYLPGYQNLKAYAAHYLQRQAMTDSLPTHFTIIHMVIAALVALILIVASVMYIGRLRRNRLVPEKGFGLRNLFEMIIDATLSIGEGVMGKKNAERFLPLIGTFVFFILLNNLMGLVPGLLPATDTLKTNLALSGLVLLVTHAIGFKTHGAGWLKHFVGPILWLAPLLIIIESLTHLVIRPGSLALRLMGNMFADHKLLGTIIMLVPVLVPLPFYVLGVLVSVVQTLVFSLLAMIYIGEAAQVHEAH
ncbi:MAG: ATP synthase F0 subunit A [Proteobacteria bacterium]|nr:MAG: ATP synthase F0 subunit A [Pseudomonadota bacterium]PIE17708.1 MAG: ATP synthase F0 subunit A [Pseudomonadota bacterium]